MKTRILIADDHGVLRGGLRALLGAEPDFEVVGEAADGLQALELASALHPDLVLLDITMPGRNGIQVTRELKARLPRTRILILTLHQEDSILWEAIDNGASGYIVKHAAESELITAIRSVLAGHLYVHPTMTQGLLRKRTPASDLEVDQVLSPREIEVLRLIALGYTSRQIAAKLKLSIRTVEGYRANLADKLDLSSPIQIANYAVRHKLIDPDRPETETSEPSG